MRKLFFISAALLCGCAQISDRVKSFLSPNEKCENIPAVEIFQVTDKFALASACEYLPYSENYSQNFSCTGMTVYVAKTADDLFYDELILEPPRGKCISFSGTYQYETNFGTVKTIPVLKMIDKYKR